MSTMTDKRAQQVCDAVQEAQNVSQREGQWSTVPEINANAIYVGVTDTITRQELDNLTTKGLLERLDKGPMYRTVRGGAAGSGEGATVPWSATFVPPIPSSPTHAVASTAKHLMM